MQKKYKCLIFDWDGTIMDSQARIVFGLKQAIVKAGFAAPDDKAIRHIIGLSLENAVRVLVTDCTDKDIIDISNNYRNTSFSSEESSTFFEGALETLNTLLDKGYYLAVATGKSKRGLNKDLQVQNIESLFHITRCADETASKPNPMMLEEILTDLNLDSSEAIMIGDTTYDIQMANNARMDSIAVTYGVHSKADLENAKPNFYIDDIRHLINVLNN